MKSHLIYLFLLVSWVLSGCATQRVSVVEGVSYNENQNRTQYFVMPYGSVSIPGKWNKTSYNSVSRQQFFTNPDSIKIAIAIGNNKYEFNPSGSLTGFKFVEAFYEWDSGYFADTYGLHTSVIEKDSASNYLIWRLFGDVNPGKFDTYFLVGERKGVVHSISVMITDKWSEPEKVKFLKEVFLTGKEG